MNQQLAPYELTPDEARYISSFRAMEDERKHCMLAASLLMADRFPKREPVKLRLVARGRGDRQPRTTKLSAVVNLT